MSITIKSATLAAVALAAAVSLTSSDALANTKAPSGPAPGSNRGQASQKSGGYYYSPYDHRMHHYYDKPVAQKKCYWLPTVANGTVTGLHQVCS
jgi:hypothetical protein